MVGTYCYRSSIYIYSVPRPNRACLRRRVFVFITFIRPIYIYMYIGPSPMIIRGMRGKLAEADAAVWRLTPEELYGGSARPSVSVTVDEASSTRAHALCPSGLKDIVDRGVALHHAAPGRSRSRWHGHLHAAATGTVSRVGSPTHHKPS
jgi:hypothetical protein